MVRVSSSMAIAEQISWYSALLLTLMLVLSCCDPSEEIRLGEGSDELHGNNKVAARMAKPCDEIYVVKEGETLQTISEKCGDPYIVEENPHIHDPDDVFPGLVIKITPFKYK